MINNIVSLLLNTLNPLALTVSFGQTTYSVDEDDGPAQPTLVLSGPSATAITVEVTSGGGSATGEYCSILINY